MTKKINLSETQKAVMESLNRERYEAERRLEDVNNKINLTTTLIFDFQNTEMPQNIKYENGVIEYEEGT